MHWFEVLLIGVFIIGAIAQIADDDTPVMRVIGAAVQVLLILGVLRYWGK